MIGIFKSKNPLNILLLLVFGVLIKLPLFLKPTIAAVHTEDGIFFKWILDILRPSGSANPVLYSFLAFTLLFIQAVMLTRFINSQRMMSKATYFPGMALLLLYFRNGIISQRRSSSIQFCFLFYQGCSLHTINKMPKVQFLILDWH